MSCWCALVAVVDLMLLLLLHLFDDVCVDCISASAIAAHTMIPGLRNTLRDEKFSKCAAALGEEDRDSVRASASIEAPQEVHTL
jgi:hypothetical protein